MTRNIKLECKESELAAIQPPIVSLLDSPLEVYGESRPQNGHVGGDRLDVFDYSSLFDHERLIREANERGFPDVARNLMRNKDLVGVLLTDTSGHGLLSDVVIPGAIHAAASLGIGYEIQQHGDVTTRLFDSLSHSRFGRDSHAKFTTLLYGEVSKATGLGRFISAGHPHPLIIRSNGELDDKARAQWTETSLPLGIVPSRSSPYLSASSSNDDMDNSYFVHSFELGHGDTVLFFTDWLSEHGNTEGRGKNYLHQTRFGDVIRASYNGSVRNLVEGIMEDALSYALLKDDRTIVGIKRS